MVKTLSILCSTALVVNLFAVDASVETGNERNIKQDASISIKKAKEKKQSKRESSNASLQKSVSQEITFDTYPIYFSLASECVKNPKTVLSFDLTTETADGMINLTLQEYYDAIARNNAPIKRAEMDETEFKRYVGCLAYNGARMAQANIDFSKIVKRQKSFSTQQLQQSAVLAFRNAENITDPILKSQLAQVSRSLKAECQFFGSTNQIKCGGLFFDFPQNQLKLGNNLLYGYNTMFGTTSNFKVAINDSDTTSIELAKEEGSTTSKDLSINKSSSVSESSSTKDTANLQGLIPSVQ